MITMLAPIVRIGPGDNKKIKKNMPDNPQKIPEYPQKYY